jgi:hypothetical protein
VPRQSKSRPSRPLTVRNFSSRGRSSVIWSPKTQQTHHLFSLTELYAFLVAEQRHDVTDIRTQVPLNTERYNAIAKQLDVKPYQKGFVATTDLVLTLKARRAPFREAQGCKTAEQLEDPIVLGRHNVEGEYWRSLGASYREVLDTSIDEVQQRNLLLVRAFLRPNSWQPNRPIDERQAILAELHAALCATPSAHLIVTCRRVAQQLHVSTGLLMAGLRYAISQGYWSVDLRFPIDPVLPPTFLFAESSE